MASELERKRAQVAQLEHEMGGYGMPDAMDLAPYKRKLMALRADKASILANEKAKLSLQYEQKLAMERAILHARLQKELQFRMRNELTSSIKSNAYGGLLNPPRLPGQSEAPKNEAYMKVRNEFKCVGEDSIPGYVVTRVLGAVSGATYIAGQPEPELENVDTPRSDRAAAVDQMVEIAIGRGANAAIGMRFDTSAPLGVSHIEVLAYGTAVNIKRDNGKGQGQGWDGSNKQVSFKEESLQELLKRVLAEEESGGGGKKKNKSQQPPEPAEDEVTFSQISAIMGLLNSKGNNPSSGGYGGGGGRSSGDGWASGGGTSGGGWGDGAGAGGGSGSGSGTWGGGGGAGAGGWGGESGSGFNAGGANAGWGETSAGGGGGGPDDPWGKNDKGGSGSNNDGWPSSGDGYGNGNSNNNNKGWGGAGDDDRSGGYNNSPSAGQWNGDYDDRNDRGHRGGRGYPSPRPNVDPRELAFFVSDFVKKMSFPSQGIRPRARRNSHQGGRKAASPMFAWELGGN